MRKKQIKSIAMSVFSKKGYYDTSMQEIADLVGIKKAALYFHFASKSDLFIEILHDTMPVMMSDWQSAIDNTQCIDLETKLKAIFMSYINEPAELRILWKRTVLMSTFDSDDDIREVTRKLVLERHDMLMQFVRDVILSHINLPEDKIHVAQVSFSTLIRGFSQWSIVASFAGESDIHDMAEQIWQNFWNGTSQLFGL